MEAEIDDPHTVAAVMVEWEDDKGNDIRTRLPKKYWTYAEIFSKKAINSLAQHGPYDHTIDLVPDSKPTFGPIYKFSEPELEALKAWLAKYEDNGRIRKSKSLYGVPALLVKKADGSFRVCCDFRALNRITIKNRYPLPLIGELQERLNTATIFSKLDLKNGYHLIRMSDKDEDKTAFRTRYGLYQWRVMPEGLCNAPATFQAMMDNIFQDLLDQGVVVYLDDILIYSESREEHEKLLKEVLKRLRNNHLQANLAKSVFEVEEVEFVGYIVSARGLAMSERKIVAVQDWPVPKTVKNVQEFLGFANFYRRFIRNFSHLTHPMTQLTKKDEPWNWTTKCEAAFQELKKRFSEAPILSHFKLSKKTIVETDASDFAAGAVISQYGFDQKFHPCAFHSRKWNPAEMNYNIHNKEAAAIIMAFKEWEHNLKSCREKIEVFTDHDNLRYFMTSKTLTRRQARWATFLGEFDFMVTYHPGDKNGKPDALSRRWDHRPEGGSEAQQPVLSLFKPDQLQLAASKVVQLMPTFKERLLEVAAEDPEYQKLKDAILGGKTEKASQWSLEEDVIYWKDRWYIPNNKDLRLAIMKDNHDSRAAGHFGVHKTIERLRQNFHWSNMDGDATDDVRSCDVCQRDKSSRHKKYGLLEPFEAPYRPWTSISMDWIVELPESNGYTQIWVVVDRLTKMAHFIPLPTKTDAKDLAQSFLRNIWKLHSPPDEIISDCDTRINSHLWQELMDLIGVKSAMSTAYHPETDGQTERVNQTLEQYLQIGRA